uniref:Transcription factor bHLH57 isoform X1 n=1 Tax=Elaeis guineensis var. tenera TaxID=51953 RepID=A0A6J0PP23_ELAGV|nr:transcription factor bHLH57 isoform X1 [Elaeis guineensis]XP_019709190.1 transcription factor bHLH57 isoform X1 [Elaeis guineensis]
MSLECLEPEVRSPSSVTEMTYGSLIPGHYHHTPFLQLLQSAMQAEEETEEREEQQLPLQVLQQQQQQQQQQALFTSFPLESNLQLLLRLQSHEHNKWTAEIDSSRAAEQLESCVTHASESQADARGVDGHEPGHDRQIPSETTRSTTAAGSRERTKRKRSRAASVASTKSAEEAESQRMAHIAVERNRRQLMNDHLAALRALMPPSFVKRQGDQASIIGGAIDFVKELEQLLLFLQAKKRLRMSAATTAGTSAASSTCTTLSRSTTSEDEGCPVPAPATAASLEGFFISPQYTSYSQSQQQHRRVKEDGEESPAAEEGVDVEAIVVQGHVNLKVAGRRRAGQLVRAISALEELRLSVLHLNIISLDPSSIVYSLNLKMEEGCKLGSADEIATAMHQIFGYINACR